MEVSALIAKVHAFNASQRKSALYVMGRIQKEDLTFGKVSAFPLAQQEQYQTIKVFVSNANRHALLVA
jgi:hypothetical protein